jgi:nitroreductase
MNKVEENVFHAIYSRRSIRAYDGREVEPQQLVSLLKAGMAAPSACNLQPWEFIVVTQKDLLERLETMAPKYNAPAAVIVCGNTKNIPWGGEDWKIDCSAAVENMMIAASAMGIGSVWIGMFKMEEVRKLFHIPEDIHVMSIVYFGYPVKEKCAATKYNEEAVFWQEYDPNRNRTIRTMDMLGDGYQDN